MEGRKLYDPSLRIFLLAMLILTLGKPLTRDVRITKRCCLFVSLAVDVGCPAVINQNKCDFGLTNLTQCPLLVGAFSTGPRLACQ
jgi:hypothetical protein